MCPCLANTQAKLEESFVTCRKLYIIIAQGNRGYIKHAIQHLVNLTPTEQYFVLQTPPHSLTASWHHKWQNPRSPYPPE